MIPWEVLKWGRLFARRPLGSSRTILCAGIGCRSIAIKPALRLQVRDKVPRQIPPACTYATAGVVISSWLPRGFLGGLHRLWWSLYHPPARNTSFTASLSSNLEMLLSASLAQKGRVVYSRRVGAGVRSKPRETANDSYGGIAVGSIRLLPVAIPNTIEQRSKRSLYRGPLRRAD